METVSDSAPSESGGSNQSVVVVTSPSPSTSLSSSPPSSTPFLASSPRLPPSLPSSSPSPSPSPSTTLSSSTIPPSTLPSSSPSPSSPLIIPPLLNLGGISSSSNIREAYSSDDEDEEEEGSKHSQDDLAIQASPRQWKPSIASARASTRKNSLLLPSGISFQPQTMDEKRIKVLMEILSTEKNFCRSLTIVLEIFMQPLRNAATTTQSIVSIEEINVIFGNVEHILAINKEFLGKLESRLLEPKAEDCVGDLFKAVLPFMKMYGEYTKNYENSRTVLQKIRTNTRFAAFLQGCASTPECNKQSLSSFLIMPIQRIPRYTLLLSELLKKTEDPHPDREYLIEAIRMSEDLASYLDECKDDKISRLVAVQLSLGSTCENLIEPWRTLERDGLLRCLDKHGQKGKEIRVILFSDIILFAGKKGQGFRSKLPLSQLWIKDLPDSPWFTNLFQICSPSAPSSTFSAKTPQDKSSWITDITAQVDKLINTNSNERSQRIDLIRTRSATMLFDKQNSRGVDPSSRLGAYIDMKSMANVRLSELPDDRRDEDPRSSIIINSGYEASHSSGSKKNLAERPNSPVIKQGFMTKKGAIVKNWKCRWWILYEDKLCYFRDDRSPQPLGFISMKEVVAIRHADPSGQFVNSFDLISRRRIYSFVLESSAEVEEWVGTLDRHLQKVRSSMSGFLTKIGNIRKSLKKRYFQLEGVDLCYYKTRDDIRPTGTISLKDAKVRLGDRRKCSFNVETKGRTYFLFSDTEKEMDAWMAAIQSVIQFGVDSTPTPTDSPTDSPRDSLVGGGEHTSPLPITSHLSLDTALSSSLPLPASKSRPLVPIRPKGLSLASNLHEDRPHSIGDISETHAPNSPTPAQAVFERANKEGLRRGGTSESLFVGRARLVSSGSTSPSSSGQLGSASTGCIMMGSSPSGGSSFTVGSLSGGFTVGESEASPSTPISASPDLGGSSEGESSGWSASSSPSPLISNHVSSSLSPRISLSRSSETVTTPSTPPTLPKATNSSSPISIPGSGVSSEAISVPTSTSPVLSVPPAATSTSPIVPVPTSTSPIVPVSISTSPIVPVTTSNSSSVPPVTLSTSPIAPVAASTPTVVPGTISNSPVVPVTTPISPNVSPTPSPVADQLSPTVQS